MSISDVCREFSTIAKDEVRRMGGLPFAPESSLADLKWEEIRVPQEYAAVQTNGNYQFQEQNEFQHVPAVGDPVISQHQQQHHAQQVCAVDPLAQTQAGCSNGGHGLEESVASATATSENPSTQDWLGQLGFSVRVPPPVKSKDAQYSPKLNKLYINQNKAVQVMFNVRPEGDPSAKVEGLKIRALAIYTRPDDFPQPVFVCYGHSRNSEGQLKCPNADHLIRCTSASLGTLYWRDPSKIILYVGLSLIRRFLIARYFHRIICSVIPHCFLSFPAPQRCGGRARGPAWLH